MNELGQFVYPRIKALKDRAEVDRFGNVVINGSVFQEITEQLLKATMDEYPKEVGGCTYKGQCAFQNIVVQIQSKEGTEK